MLFAMYDYICYRNRLRRYSHQNMIADGWHLALPEHFPGYESFPPGSILIASTADSFLSWLIMYFTNSVASHVAMFVGDGIVHDMTTAGSLNHSFADYFDGKSFLMVGKPPAPLEKDPEELKAYLLGQPKVPYGWLSAFQMFVGIVTARRHEFAWRVFVDVSILFAVTGAVLLPISNAPSLLLAVLWFLYAVIVANNRWHRFRRGGGATYPNK